MLLPGLQFGGKSEDKDSILSVNMSGKTILLYDLNERENALELAFQPRYGTIVAYQWFGNGFIIAGFSSGYVVIISTHLNEIGQEQYCAKFHEYSLREISYNEANGTVATCGDNCIKVVRMSDWKEIAVEYLESDVPSSASSSGASVSADLSLGVGSNGPSSTGSNGSIGSNVSGGALSFEGLQWTSDGRILSVSCNTGCLYNFMVLGSALRSSIFDSKSPLMAAFKPMAPWTMLATLLALLGMLVWLASVYFRVSSFDLLRAMTGFVEGI